MAERRPLVLVSGRHVELPPGDTLPSSVTLASQVEAEAGVENTKVMTPLRTAQAIAALAPGGGGAPPNLGLIFNPGGTLL